MLRCACMLTLLTWGWNVYELQSILDLLVCNYAVFQWCVFECWRYLVESMHVATPLNSSWIVLPASACVPCGEHVCQLVWTLQWLNVSKCVCAFYTLQEEFRLGRPRPELVPLLVSAWMNTICMQWTVLGFMSDKQRHICAKKLSLHLRLWLFACFCLST